MAPKLYMKYVSPPCRAVLTVAKALNLELETVVVNDEFMSGPDILKLNPQHTIPILKDEDFVIWESHAINGYLVSEYGPDDTLYPKEPRQRALVDQRLHFESGVLYPRFMEAFLPIIMGTSTQISEKCFEKIDEACEFLDAFLEDRTWLAGIEVTIADLSILCTMTAVEIAMPIDPEKFPRLADWIQRGKELPYFKEANEECLDKTQEFMTEKLGLS